MVVQVQRAERSPALICDFLPRPHSRLRFSPPSTVNFESEFVSPSLVDGRLCRETVVVRQEIIYATLIAGKKFLEMERFRER